MNFKQKEIIFNNIGEVHPISGGQKKKKLSFSIKKDILPAMALTPFEFQACWPALQMSSLPVPIICTSQFFKQKYIHVYLLFIYV